MTWTEAEITIRTKQDLKDAVETFGIVPFFRNTLRGFSVAEHTAPEVWFTDVPGPWEWKGPVIRETGCVYGKLFEGKAAYVRPDLYEDLANFRRDGYDFDARCDEGLVYYRDKALYELLDSRAPILSRDLKLWGNYGKDGQKGFDASITKLQMQCYVTVSDFVYLRDKNGKEYGWGVAQYSTPEKQLGAPFRDRVYQRSPEESYQRLCTHLRKILPEADEKAIRKFLK